MRDHGAGRGRGQNWNRLPRDPRQSPRRCSHMEGRPRRAEEGAVAQRKRETWVLEHEHSDETSLPTQPRLQVHGSTLAKHAR